MRAARARIEKRGAMALMLRDAERETETETESLGLCEMERERGQGTETPRHNDRKTGNTDRNRGGERRSERQRGAIG